MSRENERTAAPPKAGGLNHRLVLHELRRRPGPSVAVVVLTAERKSMPISAAHSQLGGGEHRFFQRVQLVPSPSL
jgi:hypothetical protein